MTSIRSRHPFPDIEERAPLPTAPIEWRNEWQQEWVPPTTVVHAAQYERIRDELENRHQRRRGVANFTPNAALPEGPGLRRRLVKQRQRLGTLDPELRRLQHAKLRAKGKR